MVWWEDDSIREIFKKYGIERTVYHFIMGDFTISYLSGKLDETEESPAFIEFFVFTMDKSVNFLCRSELDLEKFVPLIIKCKTFEAAQSFAAQWHVSKMLETM